MAELIANIQPGNCTHSCVVMACLLSLHDHRGAASTKHTPSPSHVEPVVDGRPLLPSLPPLLLWRATPALVPLKGRLPLPPGNKQPGLLVLMSCPAVLHDKLARVLLQLPVPVVPAGVCVSAEDTLALPALPGRLPLLLDTNRSDEAAAPAAIAAAGSP